MSFDMLHRFHNKFSCENLTNLHFLHNIKSALIKVANEILLATPVALSWVLILRTPSALFYIIHQICQPPMNTSTSFAAAVSPPSPSAVHSSVCTTGYPSPFHLSYSSIILIIFPQNCIRWHYQATLPMC